MEATRRLTLRLFGATAVIAVGSFWAQVEGLIGQGGVWPAAETMAQVRAADVSVWQLPTLGWLSASDAMLHALCAAGVVCGLLLCALVTPRLALVGLYVSWLSLVQLGGPFLSFQWDILLLEASVMLIPLAGPRPGRWAFALVGWLAFKVTFSSGVVKLLSGDPTWRDLTALTYHWWSQPLPTWTSVLAARLPLGLQQLLCAVMFVLELGFPLLAFGPRPARLASAAGMIALQVGLFAGGNYSSFNLLTIALCVPLLDDRVLVRLRLAREASPEPAAGRRPALGWSLVAVVALLGVVRFFDRHRLIPAPVDRALGAVSPFFLVNSYGAFAVMTKSRPEIILEGSTDGTAWTPYEFRWKPGALDARPQFVAPWQPRLDWQMWFAALGTCGENPWLLRTQQRLLEGGHPQVEALFARVPPERPRFVRTRIFEYRFAPPGDHDWWTRRETGPYCPELTLGPDGALRRAPSP